MQTAIIYILVLVSVQIKRLSRSHNHVRTICIYHKSRTYIHFLVRGKYICANISISTYLANLYLINTPNKYLIILER